jgi:hypothetical protein
MFRLPALLLVYLICLPLAIFAGYSLAHPYEFKGLAVLGFVLVGIAFPLLMKWHHALLILAWNSFLIVFFLPSQPSLGIVMGIVSFGMSLLARTMDKNKKFIGVPSLTLPLIVMGLIVVETIVLTGGIGSRILGSDNYGGRRYVTVFGAILGYFALTAQPIRPKNRKLFAALFFLSALTGAISDLAYALGPSFYFLFAFVSANLASLQAITQETLLRFSGLSFASMALWYFLFLRYGLAGTLQNPFRLLLLLLAFAGSLFGGYRSSIIVLGIVFLYQFYYEGLTRTKHLFLFLVGFLLSGVLLVAFIDSLPLSFQRSLSFLPLNVDPRARQDAEGTLDWRLQIWKTVLPDVPKYLLVGKGYSFNATDYFLTQEAMKRGAYTSYEDTLISGNYHNGILTTIIPLGAAGMVAFLWFLWAGFRVLKRNYRYGDPSLRRVNTFLLAYYVARTVFYFVFYGQFDGDLAFFTGVLGLSVSLNNGVAGPEPVSSPQQETLAHAEPVPA